MARFKQLDIKDEKDLLERCFFTPEAADAEVKRMFDELEEKLKQETAPPPLKTRPENVLQVYSMSEIGAIFQQRKNDFNYFNTPKPSTSSTTAVVTEPVPSTSGEQPKKSKSTAMD
jgi:hypothetical protein